MIATFAERNRSLFKAYFSQPKRAVLFSACCIGALFCFYRIARFTPQPLDASNTLRPILNRWFVAFIGWYSHPEQAYEAWKQFCFLALLVPPTLAVLNYANEHQIFHLPRWAMRSLCSRRVLFATIAGCLIVCRYPTFLDYQLNPDEGEFLSAAHKLFYDGNFFHSVDCGTSGPLNIYPLMLPAIFGFSPDFASSRVIVLVIIFSLTYLLYRSVRLLASDSLARIAILPAVGLFAVFRNPNLIHYSSEQTPVLIVSVALYVSVRVLRHPANFRSQLILLGLLTSLAFFSKMQSVPIVVAFAASSIAYVHATGNADRLWRPSLLFLGGTLPVLILNAALCLARGVWNDFWISYIVSNQRYTELRANFITDLPRFMQYLVGTIEIRFFLLTFLAIASTYLVIKVRRDTAGEQNAFIKMLGISATVFAAAMAVQPTGTWEVIGYLSLLGIFTFPFYILLCYTKGSFGIDPVRWLGLSSVLAIAAALFSIYKPHRLFPHYLLLMLAPVCLAMAWLLVRQGMDLIPRADKSDLDAGHHRSWFYARSASVMLYAVLTVTSQIYVWGSQDETNFKNVVPTLREPEGDLIRALTSPLGKITVWGWAADAYLGSGHVAGTRDLNLFYLFIAPPEITRYYRARFLHDLRQKPPELFIDAVGASSWSFVDPTLYNFEQFPEIASFVETNYVHFTDAYERRYFVRRDLALRAQSAHLPRRCDASALRCADKPAVAYVQDAAIASIVQNLPAVNLPSHARIDVEFTPMARQTENATVFSNEAQPHSFRGFRFQNIGGDRYRLILGLGQTWAFSKSVLLPQGKPVSLSIEFDGKDVYIRCNGVAVDDMHMPSPMADAEGPISLGSWIGGQCRFTGGINFFRLVHLEKAG